jgi:hypothetical protein
MKKRDVILGQVYAVKVSDHIQPVRLIAESPYGGWVGRNEGTGRKVRIRSAAKLRARLEKKGDKWRLALNKQPDRAPEADHQFQRGLTDQGVPY